MILSNSFTQWTFVLVQFLDVALFQNNVYITYVYFCSGVMGPDENVYNVNNNVYTNYVAKLALETPHYIRDKMNMWVDLSLSLTPSPLLLHPEHWFPLYWLW